MKKINKITGIILVFALTGPGFAYSIDTLRVPVNTKQTIDRAEKVEVKIKLADIISRIGNQAGPPVIYNMRPFNLDDFIGSVKKSETFNNHYGGDWHRFIKDLENNHRSAAYAYLLNHLQPKHKSHIYRIKEQHALIKEMVPDLIAEKINARKANEPIYIRLVTLGGEYDPFSLGATLIESMESELKNNYPDLALGRDVILKIQDVQLDPGINDEIKKIKEFTVKQTMYEGRPVPEEVKQHMKALNKNRNRLSGIIKFRYGSIGDTRPGGLMADVLKDNPDLVVCNLVFYHLDVWHQKNFIDFIGRTASEKTTFMFAFNTELLTYGDDRYVDEFNGDRDLALQVRPTYAKDYPPFFEKYFKLRSVPIGQLNSNFYIMHRKDTLSRLENTKNRAFQPEIYNILSANKILQETL
ncbi:MAG: hypothetical protein WC312_04340 [Candidatus Omnitrophota bacterium]|jgi:hypothetical protein